MITVDFIEAMGNDLTVANAARVSFGKTSTMTENQWGPPTLKDKDAKLINFLAKYKHISPFGHCFASFRIKAPIFVARQLVKHQYLRWNETSRRYVDDDPEFYFPEVWRAKAEDVKQGSGGAAQSQYFPTTYLEQSANESVARYRKMLSQGICAEQARMVLPQNMMTEWWWSGSLDAFADMCRLRLKSDTQFETSIVASCIDAKMKELYPVSWKALLL